MTGSNAAGPFGVIGGGAWGTALAQCLASDGSMVRLWALETEVADAINQTRQNPLFLPGITLSAAITATGDLAIMADCRHILLVAPAQHCAGLVAMLPDHGQTLIVCSKGMDKASGQLLGDTIAATGWSGEIAILSGPTFAHEVAAGLPAAVTLAARDMATARTIATAIARPQFRPYAASDRVGAQIGGVVKNILAVACGVVEGARLGENARAALIARGFAEMTRYGLARGAQIETLAGLAGLGDLVLTCSSRASRNFSLGVALGEGAAAAQLIADRHTVAEGALSAPILVADADARGIDMPICTAVARLVSDGANASAIIAELLARPLTNEGWASLG
jgi:glycerol-3-phosphate dehydrogenase (NAD(P)+)